jgi:hypothetical protein
VIRDVVDADVDTLLAVRQGGGGGRQFLGIDEWDS